MITVWHIYYRNILTKLIYMTDQFVLKGTKREKLHAMHVKELIKTNYSEW